MQADSSAGRLAGLPAICVAGLSAGRLADSSAVCEADWWIIPYYILGNLGVSGERRAGP